MTLYTFKQAAKKLGLSESSIHSMRGKPGFPQPRHRTSTGTHLFGEDQLQDLEAFVSLKHGNLFSRAQVARILNIHCNTLRDWIASGRVPPPTRGNALRRYYTAAEVTGIKQKLPELYGNKLVPSYEAEAFGFFTQKGASRYFDMPHITFTTFIAKGRIPKPTHRVNGYLCYTAQELDHFRLHQLRDYFEKRNKGWDKVQ